MKLDRRTVWLAEARISAPQMDPHPCHVCMFTFDLSHAHHVIPLSVQCDAGYQTPNHERVWLCPNHHAMVHYLLREIGADTDDNWLGSKIRGCHLMTRDSPSDGEIAKIISLVGRGKVPTS